MIEIPKENKWIKLDSQNDSKPSARSGHCSTILKNRWFYIFGGLTQSEALNDLHSFDLQTKEWQKVHKGEMQGAIPAERASSQMTCHQELQRLYLFGGTQFIAENLCPNDLYEFDIRKKQWRVVLNNSTFVGKPSERYGHSMILHDNSIYIFGGMRFIRKQNQQTPEYLNDLWKFSLIDNTWRRIEANGPIPQPRSRHTSTIINNQLFIVGGTTNLYRYGQVYRLDLHQNMWYSLELEAVKQKTKKNLFQGRFGHASFNLSGMIIIYGGFDDDICDNALQLDIQNNLWSRRRYQGSIPARDFFSFAATSNFLIIFGGRNAQNQRLNDLYQWNFTLETNNQIYCTLKEDTFNLLNDNNNFSDVTIYNNENQISQNVHSPLLKIRMENLYKLIEKKSQSQELHLDINDKLIQVLVLFIYKGEFDVSLIENVQMDKLLYWSVYLGQPMFCKIISLIFLLQCQNNDDYLHLQSLLQTLVPTVNNQATSVFQSTLVLIDLKQSIKSIILTKTLEIRSFDQKDKDKLKLSLSQLDSLEKSLFSSIWDKCNEQYYQDMQLLKESKVQQGTCDMVIQVSNTEVQVHSFVMISRCAYFKALLQFNYVDRQGTINIQLQDKFVDNDPQVFQILLGYLYFGHKALKEQFNLSTPLLIKLYTLSSYFLLTNQCYLYLVQDTIASFLRINNCIELLKLGDKIQAHVLVAKSISFIANNLKQIVTTMPDSMNEIPHEYTIELLKLVGDKL